MQASRRKKLWIALAGVLALSTLVWCLVAWWESPEHRVPRLLKQLDAAASTGGGKGDWYPRMPWERGQGDIEGELDALGDSAVPALIQALDDPNYFIRWSAVHQLGKIGDPRAVEPLLDVLQLRFGDPRWHPQVQEEAALALEKNANPQVVQTLLACLNDIGSSARAAAALVLGNLHEARAYEPLLELLNDESASESSAHGTSPSPRAAAAEALGRLGDRRAIEPLKKVLAGKPGAQVTMAAEQALRQLGASLPPENLWVYVGTYTDAASKGIYRFRLESEHGLLERGDPVLVAEVPNPSFLAVHPNHHFLYAANEIEHFAGKNSGAVSALSLDPPIGKPGVAEPATVSGNRPVPPGSRSCGEECPGCQLRQRQRRGAAHPIGRPARPDHRRRPAPRLEREPPAATRPARPLHHARAGRSFRGRGRSWPRQAPCLSLRRRQGNTHPERASIRRRCRRGRPPAFHFSPQRRHAGLRGYDETGLTRDRRGQRAARWLRHRGRCLRHHGRHDCCQCEYCRILKQRPHWKLCQRRRDGLYRQSGFGHKHLRGNPRRLQRDGGQHVPRWRHVERKAGNTVTIDQNANFYALGTVVGNLDCSGNLFVGGEKAAGILSVKGNYVEGAEENLQIDIGGTTVGAQYDQLQVSGSAMLAGTIAVATINGFMPSSGMLFTFMTYDSMSGNFGTESSGIFNHYVEGPKSYTVAV
jgi:HEAT repeat protein